MTITENHAIILSAMDITASVAIEDRIQACGKYIAFFSVVAIALHLLLRFLFGSSEFWQQAPLIVSLIVGGTPLVFSLMAKAAKGNFGSDLLAGIAIVTSVFVGEHLAGVLVVLMLSGGEALEIFALRRASAVLEALAKRTPTVAHRVTPSGLEDIAVQVVSPGEVLTVLPHELCPVDGEVLEGQSTMDESFLTGEPFLISKTPGCEVISGAINGEGSLTIKALRAAKDSRFAKIMQVMEASRQHRPNLRRLGDTLGALYTPVAVGIAIIAWILSGSAERFLAVLVIATPCPLLIAIPIVIIGTISLAAKRSIVIRDPAVLEQASTCTVIIFDKTGTLTHGEPTLSEVVSISGYEEQLALQLAASLEQYSKHPLAGAVVSAAKIRSLSFLEVSEAREKPGSGLVGRVHGKEVIITSRAKLNPDEQSLLPPQTAGLECVIVVDGVPRALFRFRDEPRRDSAQFIGHLGKHHRISRVLLVSGDRESEVSYLAEKVGIREVVFNASPEEKVAIVRRETSKARTLFLGDGINDAPALLAATVGVAFGSRSDITAEAAGAVILEPTLKKVDEFLHLGFHMRSIALQSAVGGMLASLIGIFFAAAGYIPPVAGACIQEGIDLFAVLNALRAARVPRKISDI